MYGPAGTTKSTSKEQAQTNTADSTIKGGTQLLYDFLLYSRNIRLTYTQKLSHFLLSVFPSIVKFDSTGYDLEDLVSIGSLGLIKGIMTYKVDKNIKLATYASRCITNEILMYIRKNKNRKGEVSFEDALNYDSEGNELHLEDIMGTEEDVVHDEIENKLAQIFQIVTCTVELFGEKDDQTKIVLD